MHDPISPSQFLTESLRQADWGPAAARIMAAAIQAVDPGTAVKKTLSKSEKQILVGEKKFDLSAIQRIYIIGAGKAGYPMLLSAVEILHPHLEKACAIVKQGYGAQDFRSLDKSGASKNTSDTPLDNLMEIFEAGHPVPDERGIDATRYLLSMLADTQPGDLVFCLISGGGSALLTSPAAGVSLLDLQDLTSNLLACGATINEINSLRKHLDQVKGGGLARFAAPASIVTLILSDVVGDPLDVIASGPTVPDPSTFADALAVIDKYNLIEKTSPEILDHLTKGRDGKIPDTPKPGDPAFARVQNVVIGSNKQACQAASLQADKEGYNSMILTTYLQGEAKQAGGFLVSVLRQLAEENQPIPHPACIIAGGETTVILQGGGLGGRNQELALSAVHDLGRLKEAGLVSLATDGGDGPTDAAGAVATQDTLYRARAMGMEPAEYLARNDSYHFFNRLGDLLKPGPTFTNVNDIQLLFAGTPQ